MDPKRQKALAEAYVKQERDFKVNDQYRRNYDYAPITSKFYSRFDANDYSLADPKIVHEIRQFKDMGPRNKYNWPVTSSNEYGWYTRTLVNMDRKDSRFYHPRHMPEFVAQGLRLKHDITMQIPKFAGIPFLLG